jgi:putative PIN family toxin of toxin-antitoxin system
MADVDVTNRVVFDCNTFIQAAANPNGAAGRCVHLVLIGTVELFVSSKVLDELRGLADRPKVMRKLRLTPERVVAFGTTIERAASVLSNVPDRFTHARDPDDSIYVNLALAADARLIVSRDLDLLDLMDRSLPDARVFQSRFPQLRIVTPPEFLREFEADPYAGL